MLAIAFTFPAGRYHATPWGRHVNEADVAWPPDLWRISRALIAVWHRKLDHSLFPPERLHLLLSRLAEAPAPSYRLPAVAIHSHTRHYMPGRADKKTLVFDAFARVDPNEPLVIAWPGLSLDPSAVQLLDGLIDNLGFLGRAESWVEARRVDWGGGFDCLPAGQTISMDTGEWHGEIVRLLAPQPPAAYAEFRTVRLNGALIALDAHLEPAARLSREQKKLTMTLPRDWLAAIGVETSQLQAAGWSAPPCAQSISYRRPPNSLQSTAPPPVESRRGVPESRSRLTTARFVVYGKPLPRLEDAVRVGEAMRRAAMGLAKRMLGEHALPPELSGHDLDAENRHGHAFWLPEDADGDGAIDHLIVHVGKGFGNDAVRVLTALQTLRIDGAEPLRLVLEGVGTAAQFGEVSECAGSSAFWRSVTPYLHPWYLKKPELRSAQSQFDAVVTQLKREWRLRGDDRPAIESVVEVQRTVAGGRSLEPVHFKRSRQKRGLMQPDTLGRMLELRFSAPVQGPVALGFGCHFGLGMFAVPDRVELCFPR